MGIYLYPTDEKWFKFLAARSPLDEVNFWQPGGSHEFNRLQTGELFLFRLKHPVNKIAGGGIFRHASLYPLNAAWEAFQDKNGVASFDELYAAIARYRAKNAGALLHEDSRIGCIILQSPFFLPEARWISVPEDYHANLVQGKRFALDSPSGHRLYDWAINEMQRHTLLKVSEKPAPVYGEPILIRPRVGQGTFRVMISDAYERRCAVTGEKTLPVLEAAHIKPVSKGGEHRIDNGLLLRSDLHTLFDLGYTTITTTGEFRVSSKLREEWQNGAIYYALDKSIVRLPANQQAVPSKTFLEWHNDEIFRT